MRKVSEVEKSKNTALEYCLSLHTMCNAVSYIESTVYNRVLLEKNPLLNNNQSMYGMMILF